jgi:hypothetical protein
MVDASIGIHRPEIKATVEDHDWFYCFKISGVTFFLDKPQDLINFKNVIISAFDSYSREYERKQDLP